MPAILALENVSKSFGAPKVTDGISLSVTEGETLGILGPKRRGQDDAVQPHQRDFAPMPAGSCSSTRT